MADVWARVWVLALDARVRVAAVVVVVHCASMGLHRKLNRQRTKKKKRGLGTKNGCQSIC